MVRRLFLIAPLLMAMGALPASSQTPATTAPAVDNGWQSQFFDYSKPSAMVVEERTPTAAQLDFHRRPPQLDNAMPPESSDKAARPAIVGRMAVVHLRFRDSDGSDVPILLCLPRDKKGPFPLVVAVHGLTSNKAQVCAQVAQQLVGDGFAVLAFDLPLHGERPGDPSALIDLQDPVKCIAPLQQSVLDVKQCIDLAETRSDLDTTHGVMLIGYSMGSLIDTVAGAADPRVRAMCLMVGGVPDFPPALSLVPQFAALQPQLAMPHFAGRPLLMLNGRDDQTVTPEMSNRLYNAAENPKQLVWFKSGHLLPADAYEQAADWIAKTWKDLQAAPIANHKDHDK